MEVYDVWWNGEGGGRDNQKDGGMGGEGKRGWIEIGKNGRRDQGSRKGVMVVGSKRAKEKKGTFSPSSDRNAHSEETNHNDINNSNINNKSNVTLTCLSDVISSSVSFSSQENSTSHSFEFSSLSSQSSPNISTDPMTTSRPLIRGPVCVDAHAYGNRL